MSSKKRPPPLSLGFKPDMDHGLSPFRLLDGRGREILLANKFLDALATRGLSERSLRAYGFSLLNFWRWLRADKVALKALTEADLLRYIRFQYQIHPAKSKVAPTTINHRLTVARSLYRYHTGVEIPAGRGTYRRPPPPYHLGPKSEYGYLHPSRPRRGRQLRVQAPRRAVIPLSKEEVGDFLESLRTWRDLSIVALMLFCGLRSHEVIDLDLLDLHFGEGQVKLRGKGDKERIVPLPPEVTSLLKAYLSAERPETASQKLFVSLKGGRRGASMTLAGLRTIFRYHRKRSGVLKANPHRFRHTFGTDMARSGISIPALMHLMGHVDIHTTMLYVQLAPADVWEEFHRVARKLWRDRGQS